MNESSFMPGDSEFNKILKSHFQLDEFRIGQKEIISAVLKGKDVLAVLPTGGGKSLCYQLPALLKNDLVVVISPLIALMKDQVNGLKRVGIRAGCLHSGQTMEEKREVFAEMSKGGAFILYLSPERAQKEGFQSWIKTRSVALFAIDEAHCVSQWGHDFRADYAQLKILKTLRPDVPVLALTASATPQVLGDISYNLNLKNPERMVHGFYRPNLYYQVEQCADEDEKFHILTSALKQTPHGRVIVYCGTRKVTESLASQLDSQFEVGYYHAGLATKKRTQTQEAYDSGKIRILIATNAFGMGVDQPDVRLVVHYQMPANIDSLYQEMGRAGRDNKPSTCLMLYSKKDKGLQSFFIQSSEAPANIKSARWGNLEALINYSEGSECRHAEILTYYKDSQRIPACGHCDSCDPDSGRKIRAPKFAMYAKPILRKVKAKAEKSKYDQLLNSEQELRFQSLKRWRKRTATDLDMPAFVVFGDKTLRDLAIKNPQTQGELMGIYGIGEAKLEKFGSDLLVVLSAPGD
jgi:ATP-dependent DNA helicase RecQ